METGTLRAYYARRIVLAVGTIVMVAATAPPALAQPARTRALTLEPGSRQWAELPPPAEGTAEGDLHAIRVRIKDGKHKSALRAIRRFVKKYGEESPQYPAVKITKAEALMGRGDFYKAYEVLEEFLKDFSGMELTSEALRLEFVIAETYLTGVKRKFWGMRLRSGEDLAFRILDKISVDFPNSQWAEYAIKTKGDHLFYRTVQHGLADMEYARLIREYPRSRYYQPALRRSADTVLARYRGVEYDEAALLEAEERYRDYETRFRATAGREGVHSIINGIQQQRAEKEFTIGSYYERTDHLGSAVFYYRSVLNSWPETVAAFKARERLELLGAVDLGKSTADSEGFDSLSRPIAKR